MDCTPIFVCSNNNSEGATDTASDYMVMGAVHTPCELSLLVTQQDHSDESQQDLQNTLTRFYQKKDACCQQKMLSSVQAKINEHYATKSHWLQKQTIQKILTVMEVPEYVA